MAATGGSRRQTRDKGQGTRDKPKGKGNRGFPFFPLSLVPCPLTRVPYSSSPTLPRPCLACARRRLVWMRRSFDARVGRVLRRRFGGVAASRRSRGGVPWRPPGSLPACDAGGLDDDYAIGGHPGAGDCAQPLADPIIERRGSHRVEPQLNRGRDLVDVLTAGPRGADESLLQFGVLNDDGRCYLHLQP